MAHRAAAHTHLGKQSLFVLLSVADLALTWWLLDCSGGQVYESNPLARLLLAHHGWAGLACFKAGVVLLVLVLTAAIASYRPRLAGGVLWLGCIVLSAVVLYSAALSRAAWLSPQKSEAEVAREEDEHEERINREARDRYRRLESFWQLLTALSQDVLAGVCTLQEAAEQVASSDRARDPVWQRGLAGVYPGYAPQERMAACIIAHAVSAQPQQKAAWRVALRLEREFQLAYGRCPPLHHRRQLRGAEPEGCE